MLTKLVNYGWVGQIFLRFCKGNFLPSLQITLEKLKKTPYSLKRESARKSAAGSQRVNPRHAKTGFVVVSTRFAFYRKIIEVCVKRLGKWNIILNTVINLIPFVMVFL